MFSSCINGVVTGWGTVDSLWNTMATNQLAPTSNILKTVIDKFLNNFFLFKIITYCELVLGFMIGFTNENPKL